MQPSSMAMLIRTLYSDVTWFAKQRYKVGMYDSYLEGCYWSTRIALQQVMIFGDVWEYYYNNGTGD